MSTTRRTAVRAAGVLGLVLAMGLAAWAQATAAAPGAPPAAPPPIIPAPGAPPAAPQPGALQPAPAFSEPSLKGPPVANLTDEMVRLAIERGRQYLISLQSPDGSWGGDASASALIFMTLAYMGEHPNSDVMSKGLNYLVVQNADSNFSGKQGYGVPIRVMGLSYVHNKILGTKRSVVRQKMMEDIRRLEMGQNPDGGWRYRLDSSDYDFSVTQWPILAMREASLVGIEFPQEPLRKARDLYFKGQHPDGGWGYAANMPAGTPMSGSYGSMTAAGLASLFIISDVLDPASGCPCKRGRSQTTHTESERRMDSALDWLSKNFKPDENPGLNQWNFYWFYCMERVGIAAGYKYFGTHNWYKEGASRLVGQQFPNGAWGDPINTCFCLLFLYKGRAPILFNKLKFDGTWNAHRRDIANLTTYIEKIKEQQFHWQIVDLKSPLEELQDAPILFVTPETLPKWTDQDLKKLRAFTDTGGTILLEASCGNPAVRKGLQDLVRRVWPEWKLVRLNAAHPLWRSVYAMREKPELLGLHDGIRTAVFYSPDDISCPWHMKAFAAKAYLFNWGINLYTYATDGAPLRAKLAGNEAEKTDRYPTAVKAGPRTALKIARLVHGGNWDVGANYGGFAQLARIVKTRAAVTLDVKEAGGTPLAECGTEAGDLGDCSVAYIAGSTPLVWKPAQKDALKAYVAKGGFLWFEAVTGAPDFGQSVRQLAAEMTWQLRLLTKDHGLMTGAMDPAVGHNLASGIEFRSALKEQRMGRLNAELMGVYEGRPTHRTLFAIRRPLQPDRLRGLPVPRLQAGRRGRHRHQHRPVPDDAEINGSVRTPEINQYARRDYRKGWEV
ncbi:MAG TPA: DUF4159 domain-containing protein [Phycisphaerae bacterium]|nr:DUF4159 domain-containing protein [Phycisphaerae bacterium]